MFYFDIWHLFRVNPFPSDFMRLVNPQMTWSIGLIYLGLLFSYCQNKTKGKYTILAAMSLVFGTFSIPLAVTLGFGLGLFFLLHLASRRTFDVKIFGLIMLLFASFLYARYQIQLFYDSFKVGLTTGQFQGLIIRPQYFYLLVICPVIYRMTPKPSSAMAVCIFLPHFA